MQNIKFYVSVLLLIVFKLLKTILVGIVKRQFAKMKFKVVNLLTSSKISFNDYFCLINQANLWDNEIQT